MASRKGFMGGGNIATVAGISALCLGGGLLLYHFLNQKKCSPEGALGGAETCDDGSTIHKQKCVEGVWHDTGEYCTENPPNQVACIQNARKCVNGVTYQCQNQRWVAIGNCDVVGCPNCIPSAYDCDGSTLMYEPNCDPYLLPRQCIPTMYKLNDPICTFRPPKAVSVKVDGISIADGSTRDVYTVGECCGAPPWNCGIFGEIKHSIYPRVNFEVKVIDKFDDPVNDAEVWVQATNCRSLFINYASSFDPFKYTTTYSGPSSNIRCGPWPRGSVWLPNTDEEGIARFSTSRVLDPGPNGFATETYVIFVSKHDVTIRFQVGLLFFGRIGNGSSTACISHYNNDPWGCTY